ncbi:hypothetical protein JR065_04900 [Xanthomonas sp. AmX2]|uniref:hypothetical protein n=1 Tax=Xanthomonas sp. TaxID=29446 RepID=UPI00197EF862|nr:hypothetical protein [Xanthomonas sp.]MBN6149670.1 hypothetical protein [Xanthomonas sp.]
MRWARATLTAETDAPGEQDLLLDWLDRWRGELRACSENAGCGCCVDSFQVEAPEHALAELPPHMVGSRAWADPPSTD